MDSTAAAVAAAELWEAVVEDLEAAVAAAAAEVGPGSASRASRQPAPLAFRLRSFPRNFRNLTH